jgi:hypothetical protein
MDVVSDFRGDVTLHSSLGVIDLVGGRQTSGRSKWMRGFMDVLRADYHQEWSEYVYLSSLLLSALICPKRRLGGRA